MGLAGARYGASARRFYNTPHGVANAILLPHVMRFNAEATGEKYRDIARAMGVRVEALSLTAAREAAVEAVCQLNRDVGIPGHLREVGVRKEDIPALARRRWRMCTGGNPREASGGYRRVISGGGDCLSRVKQAVTLHRRTS